MLHNRRSIHSSRVLCKDPGTWSGVELRELSRVSSEGCLRLRSMDGGVTGNQWSEESKSRMECTSARQDSLIDDDIWRCRRPVYRKSLQPSTWRDYVRKRDCNCTLNACFACYACFSWTPTSAAKEGRFVRHLLVGFFCPPSLLSHSYYFS